MDRVSSRSYVVDVDGHLYRRNRKYIRTTSETIPSTYGGVTGADTTPVIIPQVRDNTSTVHIQDIPDNSDEPTTENSLAGTVPPPEDDRRSNLDPGTTRFTRTREVKLLRRYADFVV